MSFQCGWNQNYTFGESDFDLALAQMGDMLRGKTTTAGTVAAAVAAAAAAPTAATAGGDEKKELPELPLR